MNLRASYVAPLTKYQQFYVFGAIELFILLHSEIYSSFSLYLVVFSVVYKEHASFLTNLINKFICFPLSRQKIENAASVDREHTLCSFSPWSLKKRLVVKLCPWLEG